MNGSRANPPRYGDRASFDALNRTIEGLEARIEGLMGARERGREGVQGRAEPQQRLEVPRTNPLRDGPVAEIMQRQRALDADRERLATRPPERRIESPRAPAPQAVQQPDLAMKEIAQALVGLRQDLKRDISEGLGREVDGLRNEMRAIRQFAEVRDNGDDIRDDLQRLSQSINQLGRQSNRSEADTLRVEFDDLRSVLDGLAREDSVRRVEDRWSGLEQKISAYDQNRDDELLALAHRLDELKAQIQSASAVPALREVDSKLQAVAQAVEVLGRNVQPDDRRLVSKFEGIDQRLDEISRAIAASSRTQTSSADAAMFQRIEGRILDLADQIDSVAQRPSVDIGLGQRLEALSYRIEELANEKAAFRLEERLDQLSAMVEHSQRAPTVSADLTKHLTDISRKIDALDQGAVNDALAERFDLLARRIDELDMPVESPFADDRFTSIEGRLQAIAERLDQTGNSPADDGSVLRSLEAQIANLSTLISAPTASGAALPADFDGRMATLEEYMATNDEYIVEAARQAAEAVMQAYQYNADVGGVASSDMAAISALAEDLRALEDLMRSSEERTARTFDALHDTLVQIAGRLEQLDAPREEFYRDEREAAPAAPIIRGVAPALAMPQAAVARQQEDEYPFTGDQFDFAGVERPEPRATERAALHATPEMGSAAGAVVVSEAAVEAPTTRSRKKSLMAGIASRLTSGRKDEAIAPVERQHIDPAPSLDPGDEIAPEVANLPLEPGSGAPDVRKILERVRAGQAAAGTTPAGDAGKSDFIAAARRAARQAAEETDTIAKIAPEKKAAGAAPGAAVSFGRHRRPILMAVGAVLLAIMSYPLANTLLRGEEAPGTLPVEQASVDAPTAAEVKSADLSATQAIASAPSQNDVPVEVIEGDAPAMESDAGTSDQIVAPTVEDTGMDTGSPVLAITGAEQMTRPADVAPATQTGGFEPIEKVETTVGAKGAATGTPATEEVVVGAANPNDDVTKAISVPAAIEPASLAQSAGKGDALALFEIGSRYTEGRGVTIDMTEAAKWYALAAERDFAPAQYRLGSLYEKGQGVERNLDKARGLYEQSAKQGNASAMHNLAVLLATGGGKAPDFNAAVEWFKKAADHGVRDSQFNLAILYARGNGVKVDLEESYKWFAIAARDGDSGAAEKRDEVAHALKPEQLASAKAKLDLWKEQPLDDKANSVDLPDEWVGKGTKTASVDMKKAIRNIQAILNNNGYDAGVPDGTLGPKTVLAITAFQKSVGLPETGKIDDKLVNELLKRNKQQG